MKKRLAAVLAIVLVGLSGIISERDVSGADACDNCVTIGTWYIDNTSMSMDEVAGFLYTCFDTWGCWET